MRAFWGQSSIGCDKFWPLGFGPGKPKWIPTTTLSFLINMEIRLCLNLIDKKQFFINFFRADLNFQHRIKKIASGENCIRSKNEEMGF